MCESREVKSGRTHFLLAFCDSFVVTLVFSPLVVGFWRGTWTLSDVYLFPDNPAVSAWTSALFGIAVNLTLYFLQSFFKECLDGCHLAVYVLCSRVYTYVFGVSSVNYWRGVWHLLNVYTGTGVTSCVSSAAVGLTLLLLLRSSRRIHCPPAVIDHDVETKHFHCSTRFETKVTQNLSYLSTIFKFKVMLNLPYLSTKL